MEMVKTNWKLSKADWNIKRNKLGPFVNGFIKALLTETKDERFIGSNNSLLEDGYTKYDMTDRLLAKIIRVCGGFYWTNRGTLEYLWKHNIFYGEAETGYDLYFALKYKNKGFCKRGTEFVVWDKLQTSAGGFTMIEAVVTLEGLIDEQFPNSWQVTGKHYNRIEV